MKKLNIQESQLQSKMVEGLEVPDPKPKEVPAGLRKHVPLNQRIRQMVQTEQWRLAQEKLGNETFEEADDFNVGDDYDPHSPYEEVFDPEDKKSFTEWQKELQNEKLMKEESLKEKPVSISETGAPKAQS